MGCGQHPTTSDPITDSSLTGLTLTDEGAIIRVWSPNATGVGVVGTFNDWTPTALRATGDGYWEGEVPGVETGDHYRLEVEAADGAMLSRIDPFAAELTNSVGDAIVHNPNGYIWRTEGYQTPSWDDLVIYEMHIGTFNPTGDGVGTFRDATERLDYLEDLGVSAIQVMPINEFAGDVSWGYNPAHVYAVEEAYGGPDAYKEFIDEAHARGIAVLQDVVYNHWGPSDLSLWRFDGWQQNELGGVYFYQDWRAQTPWGHTRPDYGRPEVREFIRDNALSWLNEYRIDGLRWDSTVNIRTQNNGSGEIADGWGLMMEVNRAIAESQPWKISIAEDLQSNEWLTRPVEGGGAGFDSQWASDFVHPVRDNLIVGDDAARSMWSIRDALVGGAEGSSLRRVIYTESHDEVANGRARLPEDIWPGNADSYYSRKRSALGAALVLTAPGIPMLFQGQEFLEDEYFRDTIPLDWNRLETHAPVHALYRDLIRLRRNLDGVSGGLRGTNLNVFHVNDSDKIIAFHRWSTGGAGDDVVVLLNFSNQAYDNYEIGLPRPGTWRVRFNSDWEGYGADYGNHPAWDVTARPEALHGLGYRSAISLGAYTAVVLSQ